MALAGEVLVELAPDRVEPRRRLDDARADRGGEARSASSRGRRRTSRGGPGPRRWRRAAARRSASRSASRRPRRGPRARPAAEIRAATPSKSTGGVPSAAIAVAQGALVAIGLVPLLIIGSSPRCGPRRPGSPLSASRCPHGRCAGPPPRCSRAPRRSRGGADRARSGARPRPAASAAAPRPPPRCPGRGGAGGRLGGGDQVGVGVAGLLRAARARAVLVDRLAPRDRQHPGPRAGAVEAVVGAQRGEERLLGQLLDLIARHERAEQARDSRRLLAEEDAERRGAGGGAAPGRAWRWPRALHTRERPRRAET